jgi:hypothetical protein
MSRDKIHDTSLQSEWSITGEGTYPIDDPTATYGLDLPDTI